MFFNAKNNMQKGDRTMKKTVIILCAVLFIIAVAFFWMNKDEGNRKTTTQASISAIETTSLENITLSSEKIEEYAKDFPVISKATLYRNGEPERISPDDTRIIGMVNYIMKAYNEHNYSYITGVLEKNIIDDYYMLEEKAYLELELNSASSKELSRYNRAIISHASVIMIDDDSVSYHGEGNPFNFCFSPYNTGGVPVASILYVCGFVSEP